MAKKAHDKADVGAHDLIAAADAEAIQNQGTWMDALRRSDPELYASVDKLLDAWIDGRYEGTTMGSVEALRRLLVKSGVKVSGKSTFADFIRSRRNERSVVSG